MDRAQVTTGNPSPTPLNCSCGKQLALTPEQAGEQIECPQCGRVHVLPGEPATAVLPPTAGHERAGPFTCPHCHNPIEADPGVGAEVQCPACGSSFHVQDPNATRSFRAVRGRMLARFEILETLGQGASGVVYKARDPELDRLVALKVPRAGTVDTAQDLDRFVREARSVAQLRHPAIVVVHEVGEQDGTPFLVSDLLPGVTLADMLSGRRPGFREAAQWSFEIAQALHFAHQQGIIHRDVKPSNIMISPQGKPCVMDFGLAKRDAGEITVTIDGTVLGTPAYMSPEQARGDSHRVDGRSDVYSVGVLLYQMLTGELPFRGNTRMLLHQVLHDEPRPPRTINDRIPRDLETICLKAMAKEPGKRYSTAQALADDLQHFLRGEPIAARRVGSLERLWRWSRRNPMVASLSAAVLLLAVIGAAGATYAALTFYQLAEGEAGARANAESATQKAIVLGDEARQKRLEAVQKGIELRRQLSLQYVANGTRALLEADLGEAMLWWAKALELDEGDPLREEAHRLRLANTFRLLPRLRAVFQHEAALTWSELSPDGERVVTSSYDRTARLWSVATGKPLCPPLEHPGYVFSARFSPDGKRIATACGDGYVRLFDGLTGASQGEPLELSYSVYSVVFSPDGKKLAAASSSPGAFRPPPPGISLNDPKGIRLHAKKQPVAAVWNLETLAQGDLTRVALSRVALSRVALKGVKTHCPAIAFSADGRHVVCVGPKQDTANVHDVETGDVVYGPFSHADVPGRNFGGVSTPGMVMYVALNADESRLLTGTYNQTFHLWDVRAAKKIATALPGDTAYFSADGKRIIGKGVWDAATGKKIEESWAGGGARVAAELGAESLRVATTARSGFRVWDAAKGIALSPVLGGGSNRSRGIHLAQQGRYLVVPCEDHVARLWDMAGQAPALPPLGWGALASAYSDDGRTVVTPGTRPGLFGPEGVAQVWDSETGKPASPLFTAGSSIFGAALSPDGRRLATAAQDGTARVWDARTGKPLGKPMVHDKPVMEVFFDAAGEKILTRAVSGEYSSIQAWDPATGTMLWPGGGTTVWRGHVKLSPDRKAVALSGTETPARIFDFASGKPLSAELKHPYWVASPVFSPDGRRLATGCGDQVARIWDLASGSVLVKIIHEFSVVAAAFSPDGKRLATGDSAGNVRVWNAATGEPLSPTMACGRDVSCIAFSPNGRAVLSGSVDGQVWAHDAVTGEPLGPPWRTKGMVQEVAFRPDGRQILVQDRGGPTALWDFTADARPAADWRLLAEVISGRRIDATASVTALTDTQVSTTWQAWEKQAPPVPQVQVKSWLIGELDRLLGAQYLKDGFALISQAVTQFPDEPKFHHQRALFALYFLKIYDGLNEFRQAAEKDASNYLALARFYHQWRKGPEGLTYFTERLQEQPDSPELHLARGVLHFLLRDFPKAEVDLTRSLDLSGPGSDQAYSYRGRARAERGEWSGARSDFEAAIDLEPTNAYVYIYHAYTLRVLNELPAFREAVGPKGGPASVRTSDPEFGANMAWMSTVTPDGDPAKKLQLKLIESALKKFPKNYAYLNTYALVLVRNGRYQDALDKANAAIKAHGKEGTATDWLIMAMAAYKLDNPDDADTWLEKAEEMMARPQPPLDWDVRLELEWLHKETKALLQGG